MSALQIMEILESGRQDSVKVSVPEGLTVRKIALLLEKNGVPVWGYRFVDESRKTVWECPSGYEAGERAVRFAKLRNRFCPCEDNFDWAYLEFEKICEEQGLEFETAGERREFSKDFCDYYKQEYGKDWTLIGKSEAYKTMMLSAPGRR